MILLVSTFNCGDVFLFVCFSFVVVLKPPYEVTETGWGEFEVIIKIYFIDPNEKPVLVQLHYVASHLLFIALVVCFIMIAASQWW